jgi:hypothetical protein
VQIHPTCVHPTSYRNALKFKRKETFQTVDPSPDVSSYAPASWIIPETRRPRLKGTAFLPAQHKPFRGLTLAVGTWHADCSTASTTPGELGIVDAAINKEPPDEDRPS